MTTAVVNNQLQDELIKCVKAGLADRGWSQDELAKRSGVAQPNISTLINAKQRGSLTTWDKLLRALEDE